MTWGNTVRAVGAAWTYDETRTATAWCAGQLPAAGVVWWVLAVSGRDDYGLSYGGQFGLLCLLLFAPLYLPVLGLLHTLLHTAPAAVLARTATARRLPGPAWPRHLAATALLGTGWAAPTAWATGADFGATALSFTLLGVVPVLAVAYARRGRRPSELPQAPGRGCWGAWFTGGCAGLALAVLAAGVMALGTRMGLIDAYEPPVLSAAQVTGVWRGERGAVLRLAEGGRAELARLPMESPDSEDWMSGSFPVCDGTGTWSLERDGPDGRTRDGVLVRPAGGDGCGQATYWTISGTERAPELFVLFGDPDAGDLRVLTRDGSP